MKKLIFLILLFSFNLSLAQVISFFNALETEKGILIGAEIIDKKTNLVLNTKDKIFKWEVESLYEEFKDFSTNIVYFIPSNLSINNLSIINLTIEQTKNKRVYNSSGRAEAILPSLKIIKKTNGIALPLGNSITEDDILTVNIKNFPSTNLGYFWTFNNVLISNEKDVFVRDLKQLKDKKGILQVKVVNSSGKALIDSVYLEIQ